METDSGNGEEEELQDGEMATLRLDSGELVQIPVAYLQPREPESEQEDEVEPLRAAEGDAPQGLGAVEADVAMTAEEDEKATAEWIVKASYRELGELDKPHGRPCLRAKQYVRDIEKKYEQTVRNEDEEEKEEVEEMAERLDVHFPFLDSPARKF